ncbi:hypothetical protein AB0H29_08340 [Streptomyces thermolilacinus]
MHNTNALTAAEDLQTILTHWDHLRALLDTTQAETWPPAMGRGEYLRALEQHEVDEAARARQHAQQLTTHHDEHGRVQYECIHCNYVGEGHTHTPRADRHDHQLGERPVPLRLHVLDTCRTVELALCATADAIAADVQRSLITPPRRPNPDDEVGLALALLATRDAADPDRWRYNLGDRSAPAAARWLLARLRGESGPCLPLNSLQVERIARVAREAARRVERAVGIERRRAVAMERPCPYCGGGLTMHRDGDEAPRVTCEGGFECGAPVPVVEGRRVWARPEELVALERDLAAAEVRRRRAEARRRQRAAVKERGAA